MRIRSESGIWSSWYRATIVVGEETPDIRIDPTVVWGTILIILSSALLIGLIVYFVRTGQATKFEGSRGTKVGKKEKTKDTGSDGAVV
jgi:hypothetical protein